MAEGMLDAVKIVLEEAARKKGYEEGRKRGYEEGRRHGYIEVLRTLVDELATLGD